MEDEKKFLKKKSLKTSTPARSKNRLVARGSLSPHAKKKSKQLLRDIDHSGFKRLFQQEVGINLSILLSFSDKDTALQKAVWNFMTRDDVSRVSPSVKTLQLDGDQAAPVRYGLSTIQTLHKKFLAGSDIQCSLSTSTRNIPVNICRPTSLTWDTCLCMRCLNPELKLEKL